MIMLILFVTVCVVTWIAVMLFVCRDICKRKRQRDYVSPPTKDCKRDYT